VGKDLRVDATRNQGAARALLPRVGRRLLRFWIAPDSVAKPLLQFGVAGLAALLVLSTILVVILDRTATSQAINTSRQLTRLIGREVVQPNLSDALVDGDLARRAEFDQIVRARVLRDPVVRVKLWTTSGRIIYSDEPRLIGSSFALESDQITAFATGMVWAARTDLDRPENRYETNQRQHQLLEVYLPLRTPNGRKLLYENYLLYDSVQANGRMILLDFVPAVFGTLLVLELVQLRLAWSLASRVRAGLRDRERLLRGAIDASELERRRIARDLRDGTAQDLTALSLSLEAQSRQLARQGQDSAAKTLDEASAETRKSVRQLRTLLVDIYPENLHEQGLGASLGDLLDPFTGRGVKTSLSVPPTLRSGREAERLLYRVVREALRNVAGHAHAQSIDVRVSVENGRVTLTVRDDGRGFDVAKLSNPPPGHLGLRLLSDLAHDAGGQFHISSTVAGGTEVRLELPIQ